MIALSRGNSYLFLHSLILQDRKVGDGKIKRFRRQRRRRKHRHRGRNGQEITHKEAGYRFSPPT
ncbi:MAG: hypothetical protein C4320_06775 [Armatimonadota bacterium]